MAMICHATMATGEFTQEFEQHAQDAGMAEENVKVHLVLALN